MVLGRKQTEIGLIPEDWEVVRLGDETYFKILPSGIKPFTDKKEYLSTSSIQEWKIKNPECLIRYDNRLSRANMQPILDSVWFAKMIGTIKVYEFAENNKEEVDSYVLSTGFSGILCKNGAIPDYIKFIFLSSPFNTTKDSLCSGTTQRAINNENISTIKIPLPPLPEQQKIATVLSTIQRAVEHQDKIIEATRKLKKSLMHTLFTEGLDGEEQKETEIGRVPKSWEVVGLGEDNILTSTQYGLSLRGNTEGKYPILRMSNLTNGYVNPSDLQFVNVDETTFCKFRLERGDILFNRTNSVELVGKTSIFNLDGEFVFASYLIRLKTNPDSLNPYFLNFYLNWDTTQSRLKGLASRGVSQANISATRLKTLEILLPPPPEQQQIAHILSTVGKKIEIVERRKNTLKELFKTILHKLMSGEIRLKEVVV